MAEAVMASQVGYRDATEVGGRLSGDTSAEDRALVARAAVGDTAAFKVLVDRYQRPMAALVSRMTHSPEDVDDILQELFVRAWKGLPRFRGDAQFSTWLYRIAVNTAIKYRSRQKSEREHRAISTDDLEGGADLWAIPTDAPADAGGDPWVDAERKDRDERIRRAVGKLSEKHRAVVALHYFEGFSCEEIGRMLDCSVGTVWSRLHYACKKLKDFLPGDGL